jgi:hypothetical protein
MGVLSPAPIMPSASSIVAGQTDTHHHFIIATDPLITQTGQSTGQRGHLPGGGIPLLRLTMATAPKALANESTARSSGRAATAPGPVRPRPQRNGRRTGLHHQLTAGDLASRRRRSPRRLPSAACTQTGVLGQLGRPWQARRPQPLSLWPSKMRGQRAASITERDVATSPTTPLVIAAGYLVAKLSRPPGHQGYLRAPVNRPPAPAPAKGSPSARLNAPSPCADGYAAPRATSGPRRCR